MNIFRATLKVCPKFNTKSPHNFFSHDKWEPIEELSAVPLLMEKWKEKKKIRKLQKQKNYQNRQSKKHAPPPEITEETPSEKVQKS